MIFISAGHNSQSNSIKKDPGAIGIDGIKEGDLTIEFRDLVCEELDKLKVKYIKDSDEENLSMYLKRIKTGNGSVVIEYHFDSALSSKATGTTSIVETDADINDKNFAKSIAELTSDILGIKNRGVITEHDSHRGRLGLMREDGIICLCELCFISNREDLKAYNDYKYMLAKAHASIIKSYEDLIK